MDKSIDDFVEKARAKGLDDEQIKTKLTMAGWDKGQVDEALGTDLVVPLPPSKLSPKSNSAPLPANSDRPIAVVQNLSIRGFEYGIMFITLWAVAFSIMWMAISFVSDFFSKAANNYNYGTGDTTNAFFMTLLLVTFPIFAYMFLRLKKAELNDESLRHDPSRRKLTQLTMLVSFVTALGFTIYFIYSIITPDSSSSGSDEIVKRLVQTVIALVVAGGIFVYYWKEERRPKTNA